MSKNDSPDLWNISKDDFVANVVKMINDISPDLSPSIFERLIGHIKAVLDQAEQLRAGTSTPDNFLTIDQIECLLTELRQRQADIDFKSFIDYLKYFKAEEALINQKKNEYGILGIKLRKNRVYNTSVLTLFGRIPFQRMALLPSTLKDVEKLKEIGLASGMIFPVDEALGLNRLPFNITIAAMLEIAKESTRCESYEDAEQILKEKTAIHINDDTMRKVTNHIGRLVFDNDVKTAEYHWSEFNTGRLIFPKDITNHTLYIEVDGAMHQHVILTKKVLFIKKTSLEWLFLQIIF
ncbi:MAG: hypothetical protein LBI10_12790 [Deltaproteobacteria bacterium]|jgi:hypothetical protein|nr:hypothetical protein [Deltaproteobacteria bacterium]